MRLVEQYIQAHPDEFARAYTELRPLPRLEIEVRLDWRCNAKCKFCGVWKYDRDGMLPVARWKEIFTDLAAQGLARVLFTGGEPLLYPGFFDVIEHVDSLGVATSIITNGSLLGEANVKRLAALHALIDLTVSLDSARADVHDEVRLMRGLFKRATAGMARVRELAPHVHLTVNTVVSASTAESVKDLLSLPVLPDRLRIFPVGLDTGWLDSLADKTENNWSAWAAEAKTERLGTGVMDSISADVAQVVAEGARLGIQVDVERMHHAEPFRGDCVVPMGHIVIQPDGDVYPCCHVQDEPNRIGTLAVETVGELFSGPRYQGFLTRVRPAALPACLRCSRYRSFNETASQVLLSIGPAPAVRTAADD
jgi:radical SAM protein with 4Fe4S-binding SPASM domain